MKISIITVTYNSRHCLKETVESILNQENLGEYELEYLIIDGASSDGTKEYAEGFRDDFLEKKIDFHLQSESDSGIYDAMNKGIRLATGDIIGILNSGDWYELDTLKTVADTFQKKHCDLMFGNIRMFRTNGESFIKTARIRKYQTSRDWNHPTTFVRAQIYKENQFPCLGIHDDYAFYLKMQKQGREIQTVNKVLANFRMGGASNHKSLSAAVGRIRDRYRFCYRINGFSRWYLLECIAMETMKFILG